MSSAAAKISALVLTEMSSLKHIVSDLRQDMLTLQLIRVMEAIWKNAGLDLRLEIDILSHTGPRHAVGNMSDCRSRGRKFDAGLDGLDVPILSRRLIMK